MEKEKDLEREDNKIRFGFEFQEFFNSPAGKYFYGLLQQQQGIAIKQSLFDKSKGTKKKFACETLSEFERTRGFCLGIDTVFGIIKSHVNFAKRKEKELREEEGKTKT